MKHRSAIFRTAFQEWLDWQESQGLGPDGGGRKVSKAELKENWLEDEAWWKWKAEDEGMERWYQQAQEEGNEEAMQHINQWWQDRYPDENGGDIDGADGDEWWPEGEEWWPEQEGTDEAPCADQEGEWHDTAAEQPIQVLVEHAPGRLQMLVARQEEPDLLLDDSADCWFDNGIGVLTD